MSMLTHFQHGRSTSKAETHSIPNLFTSTTFKDTMPAARILMSAMTINQNKQEGNLRTLTFLLVSDLGVHFKACTSDLMKKRRKSAWLLL